MVLILLIETKNKQSLTLYLNRKLHGSIFLLNKNKQMMLVINSNYEPISTSLIYESVKEIIEVIKVIDVIIVDGIVDIEFLMVVLIFQILRKEFELLIDSADVIGRSFKIIIYD